MELSVIYINYYLTVQKYLQKNIKSKYEESNETNIHWTAVQVIGNIKLGKGKVTSILLSILGLERGLSTDV